MCFSAEASFGMSAVLLPTAVYCVHSAIGKSKDFLVLAIIPIIFSVQQFLEGWVWLGLGRYDATITRPAGLAYLFFALAFWPFWIPFCAFFLEPGGWRKWFLASIALLGLAGGLVLYVPLLVKPDFLVVEAVNHSVYYDISRSPVIRVLSFEWCQLLYLLIVATPPLLGEKRGFFIFGIAIVASAAASHVFFWYASASVWCFFAVALSSYLCFSFWRLPTPALLRTV